MSDEQRLDRIEQKLDKLADAVVSLARMEERMVTLFKRMDNFDTEQAAHTPRIAAVEGKIGNNGQALRFAERLFWVVITAAVGYLFMTLQK